MLVSGRGEGLILLDVTITLLTRLDRIPPPVLLSLIKEVFFLASRIVV